MAIGVDDREDEFESWLENLEQKVRLGQFQWVVDELSARKKNRKNSALFKSFALEIGKIYRRIGLPMETLRLLKPETHHNYEGSAVSAVKAEYAIALLQVGAESEAENTLGDLHPKDYPECLLYNAFVYFRKWDYTGALPHLTKYLTLIEKDFDPYRILVGQVNLAAALVGAEKFSEALTVIASALKTAGLSDYRLLHSNLLEIQTQVFLSLERWKDAERNLKNSRALTGAGNQLNNLNCDKWEAIMLLLKNGYSEKISVAFDVLRRRARSLRAAEAIRQLDLYEASATRSQKLIDTLFYGSPQPGYRNMLKLRFKNEKFTDPHWDLTLGPRKTKSAKIFEVHSGRDVTTSTQKIGISKRLLSPDTLPLKLISALLRDFYKPATIGFLFQELFPGEAFDPDLSVGRVHQAIFRTRKFIAKHLPGQLEILNEGSRYQLNSPRGLTLRLLNPEKNISSDDGFYWISDLEMGRVFSIRDLQKLSGFEKRTLFLKLKNAVTAGYFEKIGRGPQTRYRRVV
jgi:hypothetical protein